jgi:hypothetical protein
MVGEAGLEPAHPYGHRNLNPARLPIPPLARCVELKSYREVICPIFKGLLSGPGARAAGRVGVLWESSDSKSASSGSSKVP